MTVVPLKMVSKARMDKSKAHQTKKKNPHAYVEDTNTMTPRGAPSRLSGCMTHEAISNSKWVNKRTSIIYNN